MSSSPPVPAPLPPGGTVLLLGSGQLGTALGLRLTAAGYRFVAVRRDVSSLPDDFEAIAADAAAGALPPLPPVDAAVVCLPPIALPDGGNGTAAAVRALAVALSAGMPAAVSAGAPAAPPEDPPAAPSAGLPAGPGTVPRTEPGAGLPRTVLVSSTRVFDGAGSDAVLTEADAPVAGSERARALLETERAAVEHLGALILRPAGIYGPGREFLVRTVRAGRPVNHARLSNRIHQDDLVEALVALLRAADPPAVLHAVDASPAPTGDVVGHIASLLGVPTPPDDGGGPDGRVFDGALLRRVMGQLTFPGYREGYGRLLGGRPAGR